jgi:NAD(P)-dependent dehydrogenase (short-subunit alcohol dehydrogenase family)
VPPGDLVFHHPPAAFIDADGRLIQQGADMTDRPAILITGATDGLGRALAERLAADGATLILHGRDQQRLDRTADDIGGARGADRPRTVLADLADLAQVRRLAADVRQATDRLDVLVSNAGIGGGQPDGTIAAPAPMGTSCGSP